MSVAVILGSAFEEASLADFALEPTEVRTRHGAVTVHGLRGARRPAYALLRHGVPHRWLPNQIPYRAHAEALATLGCGALLVTSSVGLLDPALRLNVPMLVSDIVTLDNRLPDGSACTMHVTPEEGQSHLVLSEGLISRALNAQVAGLAADLGIAMGPEVVFGYVGGPRSKTRAENRMWAALGAQVNSMTLAPEIILANELGISCAGLVIGHKHSTPATDAPDRRTIEQSLHDSRRAQETLILAFLERGEPVAFGNHLYRYGGPQA